MICYYWDLKKNNIQDELLLKKSIYQLSDLTLVNNIDKGKLKKDCLMYAEKFSNVLTTNDDISDFKNFTWGVRERILKLENNKRRILQNCWKESEYIDYDEERVIHTLTYNLLYPTFKKTIQPEILIIFDDFFTQFEKFKNHKDLFQNFALFWGKLLLKSYDLKLSWTPKSNDDITTDVVFKKNYDSISDPIIFFPSITELSDEISKYYAIIL